MTLMVQKEVADRMCATCGSKEYGALSVAVQYYTIPTVICRAEPHCFIPQPKVASSVVHLKVSATPTVTVSDEKKFFAFFTSFPSLIIPKTKFLFVCFCFMLFVSFLLVFLGIPKVFSLNPIIIDAYCNVNKLSFRVLNRVMNKKFTLPK